MQHGEDPREVGASPAPAVTVYWRPGCSYCTRLLRALHREGVEVALRNIWDDDDARRIVRGHNRGNETVPTVVAGEEHWTNPDPARLIEHLRAARSERAGS